MLEIIKHQCIAVNKKIRLSQTKNNCIGFKNPVCSMDIVGAETQLGWCMCTVLIVYIVPPTSSHLSADIRGELYILSLDEEFLCTQSCSHTVISYTGSHLIIITSIKDDISLLHLPL